MPRYTLNVIGNDHSVDVSADCMPLLWVLRDVLNLTGTKSGCGIEVCKACTVMVNGQPERSCVMDISSAAGKRVVTIEGLAADSCLTVNPLNAEAQLIGGVVHAINATLCGEQVFVNGVAPRRNFNNRRMLRPSEMPTVSVTLMPPPAQADRTVAIGGIGELGVPTFAPALAGALLKLGGSPVRRLPLFANSQMGD